VERLVALPYTEQQHVQYGTIMRMMDTPVHFTVAQVHD
jgi:hypothetical protein